MVSEFGHHEGIESKANQKETKVFGNVKYKNEIVSQ